jgi:aryl-alcohol dehydrogenase-like predicted oxidoreductase
MDYRRFGNTDLKVSAICFGPMRFAAKEPGDDPRSLEGQRALAHAIERGVNFIHSSYEYGTRWAMAQVLMDHPKRHELHHIIKVPVPDWEDGGRFEPGKFRMRIEEALKELHAERIAVVQHLQRAKPNTDQVRIDQMAAVHDPLLEIFHAMRDEGKVGYLTTFPYTPGFCRAALAQDVFEGVVAYYNAIEMEMAQFFTRMQAHGQDFICIRPFLAGLLVDKRADREALPAGDPMRDDKWKGGYDRLELLRGMFEGEIGSLTQFAVKFALTHPIVKSLVVGLNTVEQVDQVLDAADGRYFGMDTFERALAIFEQHGPVDL